MLFIISVITNFCSWKAVLFLW